MKKILESSYLLVFFFCFSLIYPSLGVTGVNLPWSTTFDCSEWEYPSAINCAGMVLGEGAVCEYGTNKTKITDIGNYSLGGGGKGIRHYYGDGSNNQSSTFRVEFNSTPSEFWMRWYMRYEEGFKWSSESPWLLYDKFMYFHVNPGYVQNIFEWNGWDECSFYNNVDNVKSGAGNGWDTVMVNGANDGYGHKCSDGQWHCYEIHLKMDTNGSNGIAEMWVDEIKRLELTNVDFGTKTGWEDVQFPGNQSSPSNGGCEYLDWDDIAISTTGYIGPISGGSDTIPPSVSISSPIPGQTVSGILTVTASASDNVGVAGVQFKIDGNDVGAEDATSPYSISLDTTVFSDGSHTLTATARDAAGNQATSSPVSITISNGGSDTIPPSVSILSPTPGQTVSGSVTISASASDNVGVAGVQFKIDGNDVGAEDATSPYSISLDTTVFSDGSHTLTATARDAAGNQATSSPVSITISNGGGGGGEILFEETFEDAAFDTRGWYDNINLQLSTTEHIPGSTSSVEFHFNQGATTPTSGGAIRKKFTDTDTIYVSYYVKYSSNWEGSNKSYHPHEFLILSNLDGDWDGLAHNYLTTYIEQNEGEPLVAIQDAKNIDKGNIGVDLTGVTENRAVAGCNGDSDGYGNGSCYSAGSAHYNGKHWRAGSVYFQNNSGQYYKNDWHFIEVYIRLNSISNGKGVADGVIQYWYNEELIIDHSDIVLRTGQHPNMRFNQFLIAPWIGDGSPVDQKFWVDNLTIATFRPSGLVPTIPLNFETK